MKPIYKQWKAAALCLCVGLAAACTNELSEPDGLDGLRPGDVALQWLPANMAVKNVSTRVSDPKTAAEQQINNIHVFVFDAKGDYLEAQGQDAFQGYRFQEGNSTMVFRRDMFEQTTQDASNATVVVLANMPKETFHDANDDGHPDEIADLTSFNRFIYRLPSFTTSLSEDGLPMMVRKDGIDFTPDPEGQAGVRVETLQLQSLMARIDLNFKLEPAQASGSSDYPSLRFDRVGVGNFPEGATAFPQLDGTGTETDDTGIELKSIDNVSAPDFTGRLIREGEPQSLTLYMFEHARAAKALGDVEINGSKPFPDGQYPENITEAEKQRYKNWLAHDEAAYIELEGIYTNHNDYKYKVTYRLYPGADATDDFTIKSNCQYKNNITISGITVNGEGDEALLDTRVNIDTKANPYFIEMLRERRHDAHFNVTPMDVYIYEGGSVTVEIEDAGNKDWIRMEPLKRAATEAGDGKRDYFTEDLLTELARQENSTSYTVTAPSADRTYEERIYFYIDENVPTRNDGREVPDRNALLRITYTRPDGEAGEQSYTREIPIVQVGMLPVTYQPNGDEADEYTFYIEKYEEYLEYYDGKDLYNHTYDGLEWGFMGIVTDLSKQDGDEFMPWGWRNTMTIMKKFRDTSLEEDDITLNDRPRGATEYCYNKNKRNTSGQVETCHWYHPTIRELEQAMDKYYATDSVFQDNWYWSSNPGPYGDMNGGSTSKDAITWTGEHPDYARATKSMYQGNNQFSHATSEANKPYARNPDGSWDTPYNPEDWNNRWNDYPEIGVTREHEGGYASRKQVFRIRAAYIYQKPGGWSVPSLDNKDNL